MPLEKDLDIFKKIWIEPMNGKIFLRFLGVVLILALGWLFLCRKNEKVPIEEIIKNLRQLSVAAQTKEGGEVRYARPVVFDSAPGAKKNIVLISLDTLRADRLNCYGYMKRITSPQMDRFARDAVLFENCFAGSPGTLSSQMSILTGYYPSSHGVSYRRNGEMINEMRRKNEVVPDYSYLLLPGIAADRYTLAELLKIHGYHTVGIHEGGYLSAPLGYSRGFDQFICSQSYALNPDLGKKKEGIKKTYFKAISALKEIRQPFFLFFHTYEIHSPYIHEKEGRKEAQSGQKESRFSVAYDHGIHYTDLYVGHLLRWLKTKKMWDNTIILITSDHGEEFGDHYPIWYSGHGQSQYQEQNRVPLLIHDPDIVPKSHVNRRVKNNVQTVDIAPTLLALALGGSRAASMLNHAELKRDGRSLLPDLTGELFPDGQVYFEDSYKGPERIGIVSRGYKFILKYKPQESFFPFPPESAIHAAIQRTPVRELFFLPNDPREKNNLWAKYPEKARMMEKALLAKRNALMRTRKIGWRKTVEKDRQYLKELKALGYLQ